MARLVTLTLLTAAVLAPVSTATAASRRAPASAKTHHARPPRRARASSTTSAPVDSRNPVTTATAIAKRFWGGAPCGGQIKVVANSPLAAGLDPGADGWVTFGSSLGANNLGAPPATYTNCTIFLAHWQWGSWTDMESDWGMFCLTTIHEMGHLLGYKHSLKPGSVMASVFTNDANVPAACNTTWLHGWR